MVSWFPFFQMAPNQPPAPDDPAEELARGEEDADGAGSSLRQFKMMDVGGFLLTKQILGDLAIQSYSI